MHKWVYEKAEALKNEMCSIGCDNLTHENLEEAYYMSKILKNLVCIDKEYHIVDAMEKSENADNMEMIERYSDYPTKRYYREKYMPMDIDMYREDDREKMKDIDRKMGRRFYTESMPMSNMNSSSMNGNNSNGNNSRDSREGRSGMSRMKYYEHKDSADAQTKMHDLEDYMKDLSSDVTEMLVGATPEQKQMVKQKMQVLMQKF